MTQHTAGPWRAGAMSVGTDEGGDSKAICCMIGKREYAEHVANARLMATAPKLLTAVEAAFAYLESVIEYQERMGKATAEDTLEVHKLLEEALEEALGDQAKEAE